MRMRETGEHLRQKLAYLYLHAFKFSEHSGPKWPLGPKYGKGLCDVDPNKVVLAFGGCCLCATFGENRSGNATVRVQTDRQTDGHTL